MQLTQRMRSALRHRDQQTGLWSHTFVYSVAPSCRLARWSLHVRPFLREIDGEGAADRQRERTFFRARAPRGPLPWEISYCPSPKEFRLYLNLLFFSCPFPRNRQVSCKSVPPFVADRALRVAGLKSAPSWKAAVSSLAAPLESDLELLL